MKYVIIGNGAAGIQAAETIRQFDSEGSITMIGDETFPPYCRPMISLALEGSVDRNKLPVRGEGFYDDLKIRAVLGKRVTGIDVENKKVLIQEKFVGHSLQTSSTIMDPICKLLSIFGGYPGTETRHTPETEFTFDRLLIATGADPDARQSHWAEFEKHLLYAHGSACPANAGNPAGCRKSIGFGRRSGGLQGSLRAASPRASCDHADPFRLSPFPCRLMKKQAG